MKVTDVFLFLIFVFIVVYAIILLISSKKIPDALREKVIAHNGGAIFKYSDKEDFEQAFKKPKSFLLLKNGRNPIVPIELIELECNLYLERKLQ